MSNKENHYSEMLFTRKQCDRLIHVPGCIIVGIMGLVVEIPLFTAIAIVKSPYLLFKGWQRLVHDLISREGPFLETACIPIAGLTILMWPIIVIGSIIMAIFSSFFIGLYGAVIVYQVCQNLVKDFTIVKCAALKLYYNKIIINAGTFFSKRSGLCNCNGC